MNSTTKLVNAWIFLNEDEPAGTDYNSSSSTSCYQTLIQNNVYQAIDILYLCFVTTTPTGSNTCPAGDGSSYTIEIGAASHPNGLTNQDYMDYIIEDARKNNPNIKIAVTLNWGDGSLLSNIFPDPGNPDQQSADNFAANLMYYLKNFDLDGFDIDWESPISDQTTQSQFEFLINAIGAQFKQQTDRHYYLSLSPAEVGNLVAEAVNNNMDFVTLQLYSGFTTPSEFTGAGIQKSLLAYGAKFEATGPSGPDGKGYQTALNAYEGYIQGGYSVITNWRLNSENYEFEQAQQKELYRLVFPSLSAT